MRLLFLCFLFLFIINALGRPYGEIGMLSKSDSPERQPRTKVEYDDLLLFGFINLGSARQIFLVFIA
ncbi:unnamed protein product, partial [Mesorhabditis belari]|uniref:Uncharacterized protein n=1 Tax=Mesorhabditis belari TaxID=2138241 RepID=A0AAF3F002_9BILA